MIELATISEKIGGKLIEKHAAQFQSAAIDSRKVTQGTLFFCIRGPRFDGHAFAHAAVSAGATGVVCDAAGLAVVQSELATVANVSRPTLIQVASVDDGLRLAALAHRDAQKQLKVVGVTGSVGKTTTKELLAAIFRAAVGEEGTLATEGNLNNHYGVPLTLLRLQSHHRFAVIEMGMSGLGEIAALSAIAKPDVSLVTKVAPAHLAQLGTIEAIASAKSEIYEALGPSGVAVVPADDALLQSQLQRIGIPRDRWRTFGAAGEKVAGSGAVDSEVVESASLASASTFVALKFACGESLSFTLSMVGRHNANNAAAAAIAAHALGISATQIAHGLSRATPAHGRSELVRIGNLHVLADCYNASPASTIAGLNALSDAAASRRVAVLGDMLELGDTAADLHQMVGQVAARSQLDALVCVGQLAKEIASGARAAGMASDKIVETESRELAAESAKNAAGNDGWILVKASRGMRLEAVIELLSAHTGTKHAV